MKRAGDRVRHGRPDRRRRSASPRPLPPGGDSSIALTLAGDRGPDRRPTRARPTSGPPRPTSPSGRRRPNVNMSSLAVCDVDGDGKPGHRHRRARRRRPRRGRDRRGLRRLGRLGQRDDRRSRAAERREATVTSTAPDTGDQLGTAVACVDLNGDDIGDRSSPARRAPTLGHGRVYAVFGQPRLPRQSARSICRRRRPARTSSGPPRRPAPSLGSIAVRRGDPTATIAVHPRAGAGRARSRTCSRTSTRDDVGAPQIDVDARRPPTFTGIAATALAAGDLDGTRPAAARHRSSAIRAVSRSDPTRRCGAGGSTCSRTSRSTGTAPIDAASASPTITYGERRTSQLGAVAADRSTRRAAGEDLIVGAPGDDGTGAVLRLQATAPVSSCRPTPRRRTTDTIVAIAGHDRGRPLRRRARRARPRAAASDSRLGPGGRRAGNVARPSDRRRSAPPTCSAAATGWQVSALRAGLRRGRGRRAGHGGRRRRSVDRRRRIGDLVTVAPNAGGRRHQHRRRLRPLRPRTSSARAPRATGWSARCRTGPPGCCRTPRSTVTWGTRASGCSRAPPAR